MSDQYRISINLSLLAERLSKLSGRSCSEADANEWLKENEFEHDGSDWVGEAAVLPLLSASEVSRIASITNDSEVYEGESIEQILPALKPATTGPPAIDEKTRAKLKVIPGYELCIVPKLLLSSQRDMLRNWRSICRKIIKINSLSVLDDLDYIHVDDATGKLIIEARFGGHPNYLGGGHVLVCRLWSELREKMHFPDGEPYYRGSRSFFEQALDRFWFALEILGGGQSPPKRRVFTSISVEEELASNQRMLAKLLHWWPHFCARQDRFCDSLGKPIPFLHWGLGAYAMWDFTDSQYQKMRTLNCETMGDFLRSVLNESMKSG